MSDKQAFICPFCGAPYRTLISAGKVQVQCGYCRSTILVPPRLGGIVQRCPSHPDMLAVGLCNDCGKSYCDRCLIIYKVRDGKLHICSECYQNRQTNSFLGGVLASVLMLIVTLLVYVKDPSIGVIFLFCTMLVILMILYGLKKKPLTVHDSRQIQSE